MASYQRSVWSLNIMLNNYNTLKGGEDMQIMIMTDGTIMLTDGSDIKGDMEFARKLENSK